MKKNLIYLFCLIFCGLTIVSCDNDDDGDNSSQLNLSINGLEDLGAGYQYEGWIIVNSEAVSTGVFSVNSNGEMSKTSFDLDKAELDAATTFILTIEPSPDANPAPSDIHVLAGDFNANTSNLTIDHGAALGSNFSTASGKYILATPTDGAMNNENSGLWFLSLESGSPAVGLSLPALPAKGWVYEGWAVINGVPVTTGTFTSTTDFDAADSFSGTMGGPPFPGEDFLVNAPSGLTFPTDLAGGTAVISIEPVPDNSPNPFLLKPLVGGISIAATDHVTYNMNQNLAFPTGMASR